MANEIIRPTQLPARADPVASEVVPSDNGATVGGVTWADGVNAAVPVASQAEAIDGTNNSKRMTPLSTKQAIEASNAAVSIFAGQGLEGGGNLSQSRTISLSSVIDYGVL